MRRCLLNSITITCLTSSMAIASLPGSMKSDDFIIASPDHQIVVRITAGDELSYSVDYRDEPVILSSSVAMTLDGDRVLGDSPRVLSHKQRTVDETVHPLFGKFAQLANHYNELTIKLKGNYSVIFRVYDQGMAYRFATEFPDSITVCAERSDYRIPADPDCYMPVAESFKAEYEENYTHQHLSAFDEAVMCFTPMILSYSGRVKMVLTESALLDYPGMYLKKKTVNGTFSLSGVWPNYVLEAVKARPSFEIRKRAGYIARTAGTRSFPWRIAMFSDRDEDLPVNEMVWLLAEPCRLDDTSWIRPGKVAWDWWYDRNLSGVDFESGVNNETYRYYIDFAAKYHLPYIIVDGGWSDRNDLSVMRPGINIPSLVDYGRKKNVSLIIWVPTNSFIEDMDRYLDLYQEWGVAGLKIDFIERDDQEGVRICQDIATAAAKRKMVIDFHGCSKPAGTQRTYPNILNFEAVLGAEYSKWSDQANPGHHALLPFLRMLSGPLDYTPGALRNATKENFRIIRNEPMGQGTRCHELAMYVVFDAPLVMLSDAPTSYERWPDIMDFLSNVETTWDTTIVNGAKLGEFVVMSKRKGETWHVGALNNWTEREISLDLSFLPPGKFNAVIYTDGINAGKVASDYKMEQKIVDRNSPMNIKLASGGGAVMRLTPQKE